MRGTSRIARIAAVGLAGSMTLSACAAQAGALSQGAEDRSQDQVERMRSLFGAAATADTSYDQVERARSLFGAAATADTSYDEVERARGGAFGR
jgi:hypothetical protein